VPYPVLQARYASIKLNAKYKSTVFTALFSDKANLLELYNAIKGSSYDDPKDIPDEAVLKLSDAFKDLEDGEKPMLNLTVTVYNVNQGHNEEILKKSENLRGYARLVSLMREAVKKLPRKEAVKEVIRYCINNQILSTFIAEHASELCDLSIVT
jgi:hypothetical protein